MFLTDLQRIKKPYECALKYGYRGYSRGGKNGVFGLRAGDDGLSAALDTLMRKAEKDIARNLDIEPSEFPHLKKIKIVYHEPSGERVVGVLNEARAEAIFLGFAHY